MSDIKLFQIQATGVVELPGQSVAVEKSLQTLIEAHLEALLGVRFLASEFSTGKSHGGRIDTLGIDENGCPVIIEYKRALNENVINQGLFYLDWLFDHKGDFAMRVLQSYGQPATDKIEWNAPRLICIAGDFTKYDIHAVQQINRNIELIRYRRYRDDLLVLELVNATHQNSGVASSTVPDPNGPDPAPTKTFVTQIDLLNRADTKLIDLYENIKAFLTALGDDVQVNMLKHYIAYKRIKNFACVEMRMKLLLVFVKVELTPDVIIPGLTRDVTNIGHGGTGNLEITIASQSDFERAKPLLVSSYELS